MPSRIAVIPVYNEAGTILNVLERTYPLVDLVVVVDDGSTDNSAALVAEWARNHPRAVLLRLGRNRGAAGALLAGYAYVVRLLLLGWVREDDIIISLDADGQHMPEEIPAALAAMAERQADVLILRRDLSAYPWVKRVGNWGLTLWASLLSGHRYYDVECGFRLMRARVAADLLRFFTGRRYSVGQEIGIITARRGWVVDNHLRTRVPFYRHRARKRDGLINAVYGLLALLRVAFHIAYPLRERIDRILAGVSQPVPERLETAS